MITGAASGIGLAAARACAAHGMNVVLVDMPGGALEAAVASLTGGGEVLAEGVDVADRAAIERLAETTFARFGGVGFLMNNAGTSFGGRPFGAYEAWRRSFDVNLFGILHGIEAFTPRMLGQGAPGIIVNTGSKQGITNPPGDPAYNASKAAIRSLTESLALSLRNIEGAQVTAHLLVPGFTYTGLIQRRLPQKPPAAWTSEEVVAHMFTRLGEGAFYILCPDNETTPEMDARRILWGAGDIAEGRPALSRWHPDYAQAFARYMAGED